MKLVLCSRAETKSHVEWVETICQAGEIAKPVQVDMNQEAQKMKKRIAFIVIIAAGTLWSPISDAGTINSLEFIGQLKIPVDATFEGEPIIGISGLARIGDTNQYYAISDDIQNSYYYKMQIDINPGSSTPVSVSIISRQSFQNPNSPDGKFAPGSIDPEGIAFDGQNLLWTSESIGQTPTFIHQNAPDGSFIKSVVVDSKYDHTINQNPNGTPTQGVFPGGGFESLTITPDKNYLFAAPQGTLAQDQGPSNSAVTGGEQARIIKYGQDGGEWTSQAEYVYRVAPNDGEGANSFADLLAIDGNTLLALEREWLPTSTQPNDKRDVKIYEIGLANATDVSDVASLAGSDFTEVAKSLILDLDDVRNADNGVDGISSFEAMILGQMLGDGRQTLILFGDNDGWDDHQILVFAINSDLLATPIPASLPLFATALSLCAVIAGRRRRAKDA